MLTTDDFYEDPSAIVQLNKTHERKFSQLTLPINITNIKSYPAENVYSGISVRILNLHVHVYVWCIYI